MKLSYKKVVPCRILVIVSVVLVANEAKFRCIDFRMARKIRKFLVRLREE